MDGKGTPESSESSAEETTQTGVKNGKRSAAKPKGDTAKTNGGTAKADPSARDGEPEGDTNERSGVIASEEEHQGPALPYPVVAFGASAGGLEAVRGVMENLPAKTGMAYVLISHLAPDQKSFLTEIMSRFTNMPVNAIEEGQRPIQDNFYILPPGFSVQLRGGLFHLESRSTSTRIPMPIDVFFRSLAADQKNHAIGVVLSGADSDGALGLK